MEEIKIQDESGDRKYFTQLPSIVLNHSTANDQALYWQMKRYAGEDGRCFATEKTLMKKMGIGKKAYNKSLKYLLTKKWIKFVGLTGGKTRPIKTYSIVDIWRINILEYEKISAESTLSLKYEKISAESEGDKFQKHTKISAESTIEEDLSISNIQEEDLPMPDGSEINSIINLFKPINPSYGQLFQNKTQRDCVERLVKQYTKDKLITLLEALPELLRKPYAPRITTPYQLEKKMGELQIFIQQENSKKQKQWTII